MSTPTLNVPGSVNPVGLSFDLVPISNIHSGFGGIPNYYPLYFNNAAHVRVDNRSTGTLLIQFQPVGSPDVYWAAVNAGSCETFGFDWDGGLSGCILSVLTDKPALNGQLAPPSSLTPDPDDRMFRHNGFVMLTSSDQPVTSTVIRTPDRSKRSFYNPFADVNLAAGASVLYSTLGIRPPNAVSGLDFIVTTAPSGLGVAISWDGTFNNQNPLGGYTDPSNQAIILPEGDYSFEVDLPPTFDVQISNFDLVTAASFQMIVWGN